MCFSTNVTKEGISRYFPLSDSNHETVDINGNTYYDHGMGEAGFSVYFTPGSRNFVVGAPGAAIWTGSSILLREQPRRFYWRAENVYQSIIPNVLEDERFDRGGYFG